MAGRVLWSKKNKEKIHRDVISKIQLCSCGSNSAWGIVKILLDRAQKLNRSRNNKQPGFYDPVRGASKEWVEFGAKVLNEWDLLEHGGGVGYSWLTSNGKLLLRFLNEFGTNSDEWPGWAFGDEEQLPLSALSK